MKTLDTGQDKLDKIAKILRMQTLEPAEAEAARVVEEAREEAARIVADAKAEAEGLQQSVREEIDRERRVFASSLGQAGKQALESLRQQIEQSLFNEELNLATASASCDPKLIARLIEAIVGAVERDGIESSIAALIPKAVSRDEVVALLADRVLKRLQGGDVELGEFEGGVRVKLHDAQITLDISDVALRELLMRYVRKDFRNLLFGEQ